MIANLKQQFIDKDGNPTTATESAGWQLGNLRRWNDGRFEVFSLPKKTWVAAELYCCSPLPA